MFTSQLGTVKSKLANIELAVAPTTAASPYVPCDVQHSPQHQAIMAM